MAIGLSLVLGTILPFMYNGLRADVTRVAVSGQASISMLGQCGKVFKTRELDAGRSPHDLCTACLEIDPQSPCDFCIDQDGFSCSSSFFFRCSGIKVTKADESIQSACQRHLAPVSSESRVCPYGGLPLGQMLGPARIIWGGRNFMQKSSSSGLFGEVSMSLNAKSRDWGIVPATVAVDVATVAQKKESLTARLDRLGLGRLVAPGDVFLVFKRDRRMYQVTASMTTAVYHQYLPARLNFGHAGVITHISANQDNTCTDAEFTKCVYVTEQGMDGMEFRSLHEALSGQSEVLILRPNFEEGMRKKLVAKAESLFDDGQNYSYWGAVSSIMASPGESDNQSAKEAFESETIYCSYLVMALLAHVQMLNNGVSLKLPPSTLADVLLGGTRHSNLRDVLWPKHMTKLWNPKGLAPSEVIFYQQCSDGAEGSQVEAKVKYPHGWRSKRIRNGVRIKRPWAERAKWVDADVWFAGLGNVE